MNVYATVEKDNVLFIEDWRANHKISIRQPLNKEDQITLVLSDGAVFHISFLQSTNDSRYWYWHFENVVPPLSSCQLSFSGKRHAEDFCSRAFVEHVWLNGRDLAEK